MSPEDPRILIVSPSDGIRGTYSAYLRRDALVVETAEDVADGLAKAVADPPAVAIVDDAAPRAGEFLSRLHEMTRTRHTSRLLLVSAVPVDRELEFAAAVLLKPVSPEDVHGKVLRLMLDRERLIRTRERSRKDQRQVHAERNATFGA